MRKKIQCQSCILTKSSIIVVVKRTKYDSRLFTIKLNKIFQSAVSMTNIK